MVAEVEMECIINEVMTAGSETFIFTGNELRRLRGTIAGRLLMEMRDNHDV